MNLLKNINYPEDLRKLKKSATATIKRTEGRIN